MLKSDSLFSHEPEVFSELLSHCQRLHDVSQASMMQSDSLHMKTKFQFFFLKTRNVREHWLGTHIASHKGRPRIVSG